MGKERTYHRFPVPGARLKGAALDASVLNLSRTGLAIRSEHELQPGDSYSAWLETETDRSWVEGRVVWCAPLDEPSKGGAPAFEVGLSVQTIETERSPEPESESEPEPESEDGARETPASTAVRTQGIRSSPRVEVSGMRLRAGDLSAQVINLSSRGLAIRADRALDVGQDHDAMLETQDGTVYLKAMVVWCERDPEAAEYASAPYAAGLSLSDVDQRLSPLSDAFAPAPEETDSIAWPEPTAADPPEPDKALPADELAPWMASVTEEAEAERVSPARRVSRRQWIGAVGILAVVAVVWFSVGRSPGGPAAAAPEVTPETPTRIAATTQVAVDEEPPPPATVAWPATESGREAAETAEPDLQPALGTIVAKPDANVRSGPGLDYAIVRRTGDNERLPFVARQGEWFRLQAAEESWMHAVTVRAVQEAAAPLVDPPPQAAPPAQ